MPHPHNVRQLATVDSCCCVGTPGGSGYEQKKKHMKCFFEGCYHLFGSVKRLPLARVPCLNEKENANDLQNHKFPKNIESLACAFDVIGMQ